MTSIFVFIAGSVMLIYSAEKLIDRLVGVAKSLSISLFLLAIVFTGIEFDDVALGVALNLEDLDDVALGTVIGATLSIIGVALALAAILAPTEIRIPRDYLAIFLASPLVLIATALMGPLNAGVGVILIGLFVLSTVYIAARELRAEKPVFRDAEMYAEHAAVRASGSETSVLRTTPYPTRINAHAGYPAFGAGPGQRLLDDPPRTDTKRLFGWAELGLTVLALVGLIIGSVTMSVGTEGILETYGLEGTVFGATIATAVLTVEDVFLTVAPARKGAPEVGVGNIIGSVIFSLTGKLGIILLAGGLVIEPYVLSWHLPLLVAAVGLTALFLSTGRLKRWHGYALLGFYAMYWIVSLFVAGQPPAADM